MSICLVTTLKESVTDTNLLKLGDFVIHAKNSPPVWNLNVDLGAGGEVTVLVRGAGHITNSTGTSNLGTTSTFTAPSTSNKVYFTGSDYDVIVSNKYNIRKLYIARDNGTPGAGVVFDIANLAGMLNLWGVSVTGAGMYGDVDVLKDLPVLMSCYLSTNIKGSLSVLNDNTALIQYQGHLDGSLSTFSNKTALEYLYSNAVTGNVSALSSCTALQYVGMRNPNIVGNLSVFANCTNLRSLDIANTGITGDTSSLANLTNLTNFYYANTAITGTWPLV